MRKVKLFEVKARMPKNTKFGDFKITEVDTKYETALADFGDGRAVPVSTTGIMSQIAKYSPRRKTFYVRAL